MGFLKGLVGKLVLPMLKEKVAELLPNVLEEKDKEIKKAINDKVNDVVEAQCKKVTNKLKKIKQ